MFFLDPLQFFHHTYLTSNHVFAFYITPIVLWLCVWSWLASNNANMQITRSSGRGDVVITPHQEFFLRKSWFFAIFDRFLHGFCCESVTRRPSSRKQSDNRCVTFGRHENGSHLLLTTVSRRERSVLVHFLKFLEKDLKKNQSVPGTREMTDIPS
jgi:hypothetical protein